MILNCLLDFEQGCVFFPGNFELGILTQCLTSDKYIVTYTENNTKNLNNCIVILSIYYYCIFLSD